MAVNAFVVCDSVQNATNYEYLETLEKRLDAVLENPLHLKEFFISDRILGPRFKIPMKSQELNYFEANILIGRYSTAGWNVDIVKPRLTIDLPEDHIFVFIPNDKEIARRIGNLFNKN